MTTRKLAVAVAFVWLAVAGASLALAGCESALTPGTGANESNRHSISPQQYARVKVGMPRWVVRGLLGEPADDRDMEITPDEYYGSTEPYYSADDACIDYMEQYQVGRNTDDTDPTYGEINSGYYFCFGDDNRLESKAFSYTGTEAEKAGIPE
jgi:hypothetical protein